MKVDKLDFDKLVLSPVDLNKVSRAVKNHVVTKDVCNAKIKNIKNKIPDITNLATTTALNSKINQVKKYLILLTLLILILLILLLFLLRTKYLLLVIQLKKSDYNTKISEIESKITTDHDHDKYITTQESIS